MIDKELEKKKKEDDQLCTEYQEQYAGISSKFSSSLMNALCSSFALVGVYHALKLFIINVLYVPVIIYFFIEMSIYYRQMKNSSNEIIKLQESYGYYKTSNDLRFEFFLYKAKLIMVIITISILTFYILGIPIIYTLLYNPLVYI